MILFPPILTFVAIGLVTVAGIFDEVKNSKPVAGIMDKIAYFKLVNRIASQVNIDDMEWTKNLIHINWSEYYKKQIRSIQAPQKFVCPVSGITEEMEQPILINR